MEIYFSIFFPAGKFYGNDKWDDQDRKARVVPALSRHFFFISQDYTSST